MAAVRKVGIPRGMVCAVQKKRRVNRGGDERRGNRGNGVMRRRRTGKIQKWRMRRERERDKGEGVGRGEFCGTNGQVGRWDESEKKEGGSRENGLPVPGLGAPP